MTTSDQRCELPRRVMSFMAARKQDCGRPNFSSTFIALSLPFPSELLMSSVRILLSSLAVAISTAAVSAEWTKTTAIDAIEAVQAAAADDNYAYAISSTQVAKYERATGKRV